MQNEMPSISGALGLGAAALLVLCFMVGGQARTEAGFRTAVAQSTPILLVHDTRKAHVVRRSDNSPTGVVPRTGRAAGHAARNAAHSAGNVARSAAGTAGDVARSAARTTRSVFRDLFR
jgi:hypothetical protein